jgi:starch-binding outer membrane protein, SusD/RagB family
MKNNRFILYTAFALVTTMTACEKQLEEYNPGGTTAEDIWSNPTGFVTAVNAAYHNQKEWYGKEDGIFLGESGTDLWFNREKNGYGRQISKYEGLSGGDPGFSRNGWLYVWRGVNQCNAGIGRIDKAGFTDMVEKNKRLGELRFLRAFYYWHIVETWGGVMLRTKETDSAQLYAYRSPVQDFYALMIEDLLFAKDNLPNSWPGEYARAAKKAAMGMLARVYLSRAYYAPAGSAEANEYFTKARDIAKDVIDKKSELGCELWNNVADLWKPANNKNNKEALYLISYSAGNLSANPFTDANSEHNTFMALYAPKPGLVEAVSTATLGYGKVGNRRLMPTLFLLDLFDEATDARYDASFQEEWKVNTPTPYVWSAGDISAYGKVGLTPGVSSIPIGATSLLITRKAVADKATRNMVVIDRNDIYEANGAIRTPAAAQVTTHWVYPSLRKFQDILRPAAFPAATPGYNDVIVMRLAEMYMIAAEAEMKLGNNQAAADQINKLRERSAKPGQLANFMVTAGQISTDFILDERAREFCGERIRWFDLKRMLSGAQFVERIKKYNPDLTLVQPHHRLRPIRTDELTALLNGSDFKQNEGY